MATGKSDSFLVPTRRLSAVSVIAPSDISMKVEVSSKPSSGFRLISVTSASASETTSADGLVVLSDGEPAVN